MSRLGNLKNKIRDHSKNKIPRTELWLGTRIFDRLGLADTAENHVRLAGQLNHDIICLPLEDTRQTKPDFGYRYFSCREVGLIAKTCEKPIFAVIDGPFQEMVNQSGLMTVLTDWIAKKEAVAARCKEISQKTLALISQILEYPISAVVITDDFSSDSGPFINPQDINDRFTPFYDRAEKMIKSCGAPFFWHSCGSLTKLLPTIAPWHINGFCAIQSTTNDILSLYQRYKGDIMIMAGIETELLETDTPSIELQKQLKQLIEQIGPSGNLIISTSCGLINDNHIERIKMLYETIDRIGDTKPGSR